MTATISTVIILVLLEVVFQLTLREEVIEILRSHNPCFTGSCFSTITFLGE